MILDGHLVASQVLDRVRWEIAWFGSSSRPLLVVVLVWDNPASLAYIRMKRLRAEEVGMDFRLDRFPLEVTQEEIENEIRQLSLDPTIHGIIIQAPLPDHLDRYAIIECIDSAKDVDGFTKIQIGNMFLSHPWLWSCTPKGVMTLLEYYHIDVRGKNVAVLGRSNIVGKPMSLMLINAGATVVSCNSSTPYLSDITKRADIIIIAIGKPRFLTREMVTNQSIIIDVGSTFIDGKAYGDADFENLKDSVQAISPSPWGVGPMTVATLIENTWKAYKHQKNHISK